MMLFWLPMVARGQTITDLTDIDLSGLPQPTTAKALRYWFDDDAASVQTAGGLSGQYALDVSGLIEGLHTLHYQVLDTDDAVAYVSSSMFLKVGHGSEALTVKSMRYWFDDDAASVQTANGTTGSYLLDASQLIEGLHTLHYQLIDETNVTAYIGSGIFLKVGNQTAGTQAKGLCYWFDDDAATVQTINSGGVQTLDVSTLIDGLHTIHYQVMGADNQAYYVSSGIFLKTGANTGAETLTASKLMYWFDDETTIQHVDVTGGAQLLDASGLIEGLHAIHYQVLCNNGQMTPASSSIFLRMTVDAETTVAKSLRYWFDDDASTVRVTDVAGGTQTLDVSELQTGLHTLNYQLIDSNDRVSVPVTRLFLKNFDKVLADGKNRVTKYQYWLNRNSQVTQTVELASAANPYTLIALLPMQKEPIQSSQFHFEVTNGVPTIYAKNTLHVRFYDAQNYFIDGDKPFIDYSVKQEVEPVGELQATQTFEKVAENDIRWYTMQAAPGDTAAFRVSQAATVQVFAPSGEEVFKSSESASVKWAGIHTWEDGTYYLAVHDVTGSQPNMTLDYMHMDKYDVVDWDVHTVGNGGCSTVTFKGNGFGDLYAVDLYNAAGDTIHSVDVSHDSDAETAVTFDFSDAELSVYDAVFHFTEEDKLVSGVVTVEEAVDIELATNVTFPSTFLRGTSTTYTIKITNLGNMTAYCVPLELRLRTASIQDISEIRFSDNLEHFGIPQELYIDSIDDDVSTVLKEKLMEYSDLAQFVFYADSIENICYGLSQLLLDIRPNTTETFTITIKSSSAVYLDAKATDEWVPLTFRDYAYKKVKRIKRKSAGEWMCCNRQKIECVADIVANVAGSFLPPGANCATSLSITGLEAVYDILCSEGNTASEKFQKYLNSEGKSLARKLLTSAISCVTGYFDKFIFGPLKEKQKAALDKHDLSAYLKAVQEINDAKRSMGNIISSLGKGIVYGFVGKDCVEAFTKPIPNCPPCTTGCGGGGGSTPVPPSDPNDIYGYLSEAGSRFIADSVAKVNYTIEFENDTAFATASAHTIVVRDTLDARYFDLRSFLPTSIKLGEREVFLDEADVKTEGGVTTFLTTIDVRPEINAIAQVEGTYSQQTGIAEWRFTSLNPMTMEPTDDLMQGILPVNYDGTSGIGEVMFEVGVKPNKGDGTEIANRAGIVFDYEEAILTPTWVNTVDAVAPVSTILGAIQSTDSTLVLRLAGEDERSGVWKYNVYAQMGKGAMWVPVAENLTDSLCEVRIYEDIEYGFCVVATDSAGNVERKALAREFELTTCLPGDANGDGKVSITDAVYVVNYILGQFAIDFNVVAADVNGDGKVSITDAVMIVNIILGQGKTAQANALPEP